MAGEFIQIEIDPERIHLTFGSQCECEQEDTITLDQLPDAWPICPNCGETLVLVSVIVDVPMFNYGKKKKTSGSKNKSCTE